jgi:hypothetical protein
MYERGEGVPVSLDVAAETRVPPTSGNWNLVFRSVASLMQVPSNSTEKSLRKQQSLSRSRKSSPFMDAERITAMFTKSPLIQYLWWIVNPSTNSQVRGSPLVGCPPLITQYIHSYPPHLEGGSSVGNVTVSVIPQLQGVHSTELQTKGVNILKYEWPISASYGGLHHLC